MGRVRSGVCRDSGPQHCLAVPALPRFPHFRLRVDAQRIGDAVDVVEIGDDFDRVQDVAVAQAVPAQRHQVLAAYGGGGAGHEFGELRERLLAPRQSGPAIVLFDGLGPGLALGFLTEILPVRFDSIEAVVGPGDHGGKQLALGARES